MANFVPKPWVNPFGKMAILRVFNLLVFIAQKGVSSLYNIVKDIFLAYFGYNKKEVGKWPFLDQNYGLTPLVKGQFFDYLIFFCLYPTQAFFRSRISLKTFSVSLLPKKNRLDKWLFLDQNNGLTPQEKFEFFDFLNFFFYSLERRFLVLEYRKTHFPGLYCLKKTS